MEKQDLIACASSLIGFVLGALFAVIIASGVISDFKKEAISHGFAERNTTTGDFQWKEKSQ